MSVVKKKFKEFATINPGQSPKSEFYSKEEGFPFLQGNRTFGILYPKIDTYTKKTTKIAPKGSILMSVRAPVGDLNIAHTDICIGRGIAAINAIDGNNTFLYYCLKYNINNLIKQGSGTTYNSVNKDIINEFKLIMPKDAYERRLIGKILSSLDKKIELNNKINQKLEAMAKMIYDYWFVQFDFPDANGKPYKSSGGKMVYSDELKREIPEGWGVDKLSNYINVERGISYKSRDLDSSGIPMINLNSFNLDGTYKVDGLKYFNGSYSDKKVAKVNDLLIAVTDVTRNADIIGKSILLPDIFETPVVYSMDVAKIIPTKSLDIYYFNMLFNSLHFHEFIKQFASGTLVLHLDLKALSFYNIVVPPPRILEMFSDLRKSIEKKKSIIIKENLKFSKLRDWLLPMLMNGQVQVSEAANMVGEALMAAEPKVEYGKG